MELKFNMGTQKKQDITGMKIGRLTAISYIGPDKHSKSVWKLMCDCGVETSSALSSFKRGKVRSCGCLQRETVSRIMSTHKMTGSCEYVSWSGMKNRCYNKNQKSYLDYGAKGITVCDRWLESFENFLEDMGRKPAKNYTIERKEVNVGYCPDNCIWIKRAEQNKNKSNSSWMEADGRRMIVEDWARELEITGGAIHNHLRRNPGSTFQDYFTKKRKVVAA